MPSSRYSDRLQVRARSRWRPGRETGKIFEWRCGAVVQVQFAADLSVVAFRQAAKRDGSASPGFEADRAKYRSLAREALDRCWLHIRPAVLIFTQI